MNFKFIKSNKGQAFSTFQLLIAAVVALAILGILLPMITGGFDLGSNPVDVIQEKLKTAPNQPGTLIYTDTLKFSKEKTQYITAATVTKDTGFDQYQLIFANNGLDNDFAVSDTGSHLEVKNSQSVEYKLGILCADNVDGLNKFITSYKLENIELSDSGEFGEFFSENARVCVVFPRKV